MSTYQCETHYVPHDSSHIVVMHHLSNYPILNRAFGKQPINLKLEKLVNCSGIKCMEAENMDVVYLVQRQLDFCTDLIIFIVSDLPASTYRSTFNRFGTNVWQTPLISTKSIDKNNDFLCKWISIENRSHLSFLSFIPTFWTRFSFVSQL